MTNRAFLDELSTDSPAPGGGSVAALAAGRNVRAALNQKMAAADAALDGGDEVAFFPPVTGG